MDTKIAGLLGASAALLAVDAAGAAMPVPASTIDPLSASSYAELLNPVTNAMEALKADDAARAQKQSGEVQLAQYYHHHHHHHHHRHWRRRHHHHHHHHHHQWRR